MDLPGWVDTFGRTVESALQHGAALSIVLGYLVAIGLTQFVKQLPFFPSYRWAIRLLAFPFGFVTTFSVWPVPGFTAVRVFMAVAVGVSSPWIYQVATAVIHKRWPHIAESLAAKPADWEVCKKDP
jgi:hypothetical protein